MSKDALSLSTKKAVVMNGLRSGRCKLSSSGASWEFDGAIARSPDILLSDECFRGDIAADQWLLIMNHKTHRNLLHGLILDALKLKRDREIREKREKSQAAWKESGRAALGESLYPVVDYRTKLIKPESITIATPNGPLEMGFGVYSLEVDEYTQGDKDLKAQLLKPRIAKVDYEPFPTSGKTAKVRLHDLSQEKEIEFVNTWHPPLWWHTRHSLEPYYPQKYQDFLGHLFDDDENQIEMFLWLLRKACRGERVENVALFVGKGAIGKSTLEFIATNLLGESNVHTADTKSATSDKFNSSLMNKSLNLYEESSAGFNAVEFFKRMTNQKGSRRGMYQESEKVTQHAQNWVLANPDTFTLAGEPNERRFVAFRLTQTTFDNRFGKDQGHWDDITSPEEVGNFHKWLTEIWEPTGCCKYMTSAIDFKTPEFFKLITTSQFEDSKHMTIVNQIMAREEVLISGIKVSNNKKASLQDIQLVINSWLQAGIRIAKIEGESVIRLVTDMDDLIYCQDPFGYREKDKAAKEDNLDDLVDTDIGEETYDVDIDDMF